MDTDAQRLRKKHPNRIPVIVKIGTGERVIKKLNRVKFLVPANMTMGQYANIIRKRVSVENGISSDIAIFYFIGETLANMNKCVYELYEQHRDDDDFLYVTIRSESAFGNYQI